jgi:predicted chitinase
MLATVKHECADKWQPVIEFGNRAYFDQYEPNTKKGKRLGNKIMGDGYAYRGRGYVQITGRSNYEKLSQEIGVDLLTIPDMTLDQKHSFNIMKIGMEKGLFTGKKLSDYINDNKCDYVQARRIINGMDRARLIAGYAEFFEAAL